ncbi:hypothetical protein M422DRAFT_39273 [Sphaerobolus stellatus SS14]|uniref:Uncharacterized protein n=1 Tax=Sphaerobolus stellatus (strain SS14) TaxID=990650 RepID=A0A0C9T5I9_SPHS4|nr:hypothetical protein M422DRAFT_39273 [Sphaerobolus stellatus SS14]
MARNQCSLELVLWIWRFCPPPTLLIFISTCKWYHKILTTDTHLSALIWSRARLNCLHQVPCPPQGVSEYEHARFIFGTGPCVICEKPTSRFPFSYAQQVKLCNSVKCFYELRDSRDHHLQVDCHGQGSVVFKKMLSWLENGAVRLVGFDVRLRYTMRCHSDALFKEYKQQEASLTSEKLNKWCSDRIRDKLQSGKDCSFTL